MFEFGVLCEVFGIDRTADGVPPFDFRVCAETAGEPFATRHGITMTAPFSYAAAADADVVAVPATVARSFSPALLDAVRAAHTRGATLLTVCSGVFVLAEAGILAGRTVATHWYHAADLARRYPDLTVDAGVLFVDEGALITSAGTAAGIDAALHLVRRELGGEVATRIARRMVVPPQRDGGQRQFIDLPLPPGQGEGFADLLAWMEEHLDQDLPVRTLARRAAMSERTFARRFAAETGTTPGQWLVQQRVHRARRLLEETGEPIESVAHRCGFGSATLLRHHFAALVGLAPAEYRRRFAVAPATRRSGC